MPPSNNGPLGHSYRFLCEGLFASESGLVVVLVGDGWHEAGVLVHVVLDDLEPSVREPGPVLPLDSFRISLVSFLHVVEEVAVRLRVLVAHLPVEVVLESKVVV